ncbi:hypothetical protein PoB_007073900 [Plakobranchus ocellatus]|uniref:Uncharacterized protein n=1 Tax=Plakobranchus ocellatus TaxID=259542 RepID=A0AAV4DJL9_9GAST|nr:hypothetical protein PoB_007073900 [Plakobranchus ocellatus]
MSARGTECQREEQNVRERSGMSARGTECQREEQNVRESARSSRGATVSGLIPESDKSASQDGKSLDCRHERTCLSLYLAWVYICLLI